MSAIDMQESLFSFVQVQYITVTFQCEVQKHS